MDNCPVTEVYANELAVGEHLRMKKKKKKKWLMKMTRLRILDSLNPNGAGGL